MWLRSLMLGWMLALGGVSVQAADKPAPLLGQWQCQSDEGQLLLEFQSANRLIFDGEPNRYSLQPGIIVVEEEFGPVPYPYVLQGDKLTVQFPDGDALRCTRAAARRAAPAAPAKPPAAGGGSNAQLKGRLCNWGGSSSSSSGYYRITSMVFDGAGGVVYSSEATFGSDAGGYYGKSGGTPGSCGDTVQIRLQDGGTTTARVNMRQNDGRITELMINNQLWAGALCQ